MDEVRDTESTADLLDVDRACARCGYNLRGLRRNDRCPECGILVSNSLRPNLLSSAAPDWLAKIATGLHLYYWTIAIGACLYLVLKLTYDSVLHAINVGNAIAQLFAVFLITMPDATGGGSVRLGARRVARILIPLAWLVDLLIEQLPMPTGMGLIFAMTTGLVVVSTACYVAGVFALYCYLGRLAERIPNDALVCRARFLGWAFLIWIVCINVIRFCVPIVIDYWFQSGMAVATVSMWLGRLTVFPILALDVVSYLFFVRLWRAVVSAKACAQSA